MTNPDKSITDTFYTAPQFAQRGGRWQTIDTTVKTYKGPGQPFSAENSVRPIRFGASASRLVELELDRGPVTFADSALSVGKPQLDSAGAVVYSNVAQSTDLRYRVGRGSISEQLILKATGAPTSFTFHISDPSGQLGQAHVQKDGSYRFDAVIDGDVGIGIAPPMAYEEPPVGPDAQVMPQPGSAHLTVSPAGDGFDVTESVDSSWLAAHTFPIVLDPTS